MDMDGPADMTVSAETTGQTGTTAVSGIGQRIRRFRLRQNLTQGELAQGAFSVSYVSAVERGQIRPSLGALERLAERLQVTLPELMSSTPDNPLEEEPPAITWRRSGSEEGRETLAGQLREALILSRQGKIDEAISLLQELGERATAQRDVVLVHSYLGNCFLAKGEAEAAVQELQAAMPVAERVGDRELLERVRLDLGTAYFQADRPLQAVECHHACYEAIQRGIMRDPTFRLTVLSSLGTDYWALGEYARATELLEQAATLSAEVLNPQRLGDLYWTLSASYAGQGDTAQARRYALQSIQSFEQAGNVRQASYVHGRLGRAYLQANQLDDADAHLRVALEMARKMDDARGLALAESGLSELALRRQRPDEAETEGQAAVEAAERTGDAQLRAEALMAVGEALDARSKRRDANARLKDALKLLEQAESPRSLADGYARMAALYERRNEPAQALEYLKKAWATAGPRNQ